MKTTSWLAVSLVAGLVAVNVLVTGCESTSTAEEVITVTPATATLNTKGETASFVASASSTNNPLVLPLEWSIGNSELGRIINVTGLTAIYESNGKMGNNTIKVKDQINQEGVASISQGGGSALNLAVAPAGLLTGKTTATITASVASGDLALPLNWTVGDRSLGRIFSSAGATAVYETTGKTGNNTIIARDQLGREGAVAINQGSGDTPISFLKLTPSSSDPLEGVQTVTFTASAEKGDLALPITWSVRDATLGKILSSAGATAVYQSTVKVGDNTVTARDQSGQEGTAVINQIASVSSTNAP